MTSLTTVNHIDFSAVQAFGLNLWTQGCQLGGRAITWFQGAAPSFISKIQQLFSYVLATPYLKNASLLVGGICLAKPEQNTPVTRIIGICTSIIAIVGFYKEITGS